MAHESEKFKSHKPGVADFMFSVNGSSSDQEMSEQQGSIWLTTIQGVNAWLNTGRADGGGKGFGLEDILKRVSPKGICTASEVAPMLYKASYFLFFLFDNFSTNSIHEKKTELQNHPSGKGVCWWARGMQKHLDQ